MIINVNFILKLNKNYNSYFNFQKQINQVQFYNNNILFLLTAHQFPSPRSKEFEPSTTFPIESSLNDFEVSFFYKKPAIYN